MGWQIGLTGYNLSLDDNKAIILPLLLAKSVVQCIQLVASHLDQSKMTNLSRGKVISAVTMNVNSVSKLTGQNNTLVCVTCLWACCSRCILPKIVYEIKGGSLTISIQPQVDLVLWSRNSNNSNRAINLRVLVCEALALRNVFVIGCTCIPLLLVDQMKSYFSLFYANNVWMLVDVKLSSKPWSKPGKDQLSAWLMIRSDVQHFFQCR